MKKIITLILLVFPLITIAQDVTKKPYEEYCMVVATAKMLSSKVTITMDYGQERKFFSSEDQRLKDEAGKVITFNSIIDALNYLGQKGWKLVNAYPITVAGASNVYHYVMKRDVVEEEPKKQ